MKSSLFLLIIFLIRKTNSFKCGVNLLNTSKPKKINTTSKNIRNLQNITSHEMRIMIDYEILERQLSNGTIDEDYYSNISKALNSSINYLQKLFYVEGYRYLMFNGVSFPNSDTYIIRNEISNILNKEIDTDLILIPKVYFIEEGVDAAAYPIVLSSYDGRPVIGGILLGTHYDYSMINSHNFIVMLLLHEITHVLGFSNSL